MPNPFTALLGGSFDPIHNGHLHIARSILVDKRFNRVVFIPNGRHNFKRDSVFLGFDTRISLIKKAISTVPESHPSHLNPSPFSVWDIDQPDRSSGYTSDLMKKIFALYPDQEFYFVIGADNLQSLDNWHQAEWLKTHVSFLIIPRPGSDICKKQLSSLKYLYLPIPLSPISSTQIRSLIAQGKPVTGLVPASLETEITLLYSS